jgi:hypothetical protein
LTSSRWYGWPITTKPSNNTYIAPKQQEKTRRKRTTNSNNKKQKSKESARASQAQTQTDPREEEQKEKMTSEVILTKRDKEMKKKIEVVV